MSLLFLLLLLVLHPPLAAPQDALQEQDSATNSAAVGPVTFSFPAFSLGPLTEEGQDAFVPRLSKLRRVGADLTQMQWALPANLIAIVLFPQ